MHTSEYASDGGGCESTSQQLYNILGNGQQQSFALLTLQEACDPCLPLLLENTLLACLISSHSHFLLVLLSRPFVVNNRGDFR